MPVSDKTQRMYWERDHSFRDIRHPIVGFFASQRWDYIRKYLDFDDMSEVLDLGSGEGLSSYYAPKHWKVTSVDAALPMLTNNPNTRRVIADAYNLPFPDNHFDLVSCWELLHHIQNPSDAFRELHRVTKKAALVFEPNPYNPAQLAFSYFDKEHAWVRRNTFSFLPKLARSAGFVVSRFIIGGLIFPNKTPHFLFRLLKKLPYRCPAIGISQVLILEKGQEKL